MNQGIENKATRWEKLKTNQNKANKSFTRDAIRLDLKQKEQFIRGLIFFIPGVIGLAFSIFIQYENYSYYIIVNLGNCLVGLIPGTILMTLSLAGKVQKRTTYPQLSRKVFLIIISTFSVLGAVLLILALNLSYPPIVGGYFFSIMAWGFVGYFIWYYFNQNELRSS